MSTTALARRSEIAESMDEIFAPLSGENVASLLHEYTTKREALERIADVFAGSLREVVPYFIRGNIDSDTYYSAERVAARLFDFDGAVKTLDAEYWDRVLNLTDVLDCMPQARRDEWNESIRKHATPTFAAHVVFATLSELLASRQRFFAERVDGIFRSLSGNHVTNSPTGFRKRMILEHVTDTWMHSCSSKAGVIDDLRKVVARFMGRDEPHRSSTSKIIEFARRECRGEWVTIDGGALRLRCYKKGTAHLEVHPEIAYRLNNVLAYLHPNAIASEHRKRPPRKVCEFELFERPLPFPVLKVISELHDKMRNACGPGRWEHGAYWLDIDEHVRDEVVNVLASLGGVAMQDKLGRTFGAFSFDYNPREAIGHVLASGSLPDERSHQYYPTPKTLADRVLALAEIGPTHAVLEPSAGQGGLAIGLPPDRTTCVEISSLHCEVLRARGFEVYEDDFLRWESFSTGRPQYDRIVMNPPFHGDHWRAHVEHAATMLAPGGRLVAILPSGAPRRVLLPGWSLVWSEPIEGMFPGTSIVVTILVATPPSI